MLACEMYRPYSVSQHRSTPFIFSRFSFGGAKRLGCWQTRSPSAVYPIISRIYLRRTSSSLSEFHRFVPHQVTSINLSNYIVARSSMASEKQNAIETAGHSQEETQLMKVLFVEMGVGYDQHGQDITAAAMRACRDAISSNSIPAFRTGAIPGVNIDQMKLKIKLGVPHLTQSSLDVERVKSIFPYGDILSVEVVDGGLVCSSGVCLEAMGDKNDDCYVVNAAVYVGY